MKPHLRRLDRTRSVIETDPVDDKDGIAHLTLEVCRIVGCRHARRHRLHAAVQDEIERRSLQEVVQGPLLQRGGFEEFVVLPEHMNRQPRDRNTDYPAVGKEKPPEVAARPLSGAELQRVAQVLVRLLRSRLDHATRRLIALTTHVLRKGREQRNVVDPRASDKGALALPAFDHAIIDEALKGLADGRPRDAVALLKLRLRRQLVSSAETRLGDLGLYGLLQLRIQRQSRPAVEKIYHDNMMTCCNVVVNTLRRKSMRTRLVALDVDGTLLDPNHRVSSRTRRTLKAVQRSGHLVVLASSRSPQGLEPVLEQCSGSANWVIACQGAVVTETPTMARERAMIDSPIAGSTALSVADQAADFGGSVCWYVWDRLLVSRVTDAVRHEVIITGEEPEVQHHGLRGSPPPHKILAIFDDDTQAARFLQQSQKDETGIQAVLSKPSYVEITAHGVDKGRALVHLARVLGMTKRDIIAIGDGENDEALLRAAGTAVAMGNASARLLEVADHITATNDQDGVANALEALIGTTGQGLAIAGGACQERSSTIESPRAEGSIH